MTEPLSIRSIAVGVDFSEPSELAARLALRVARHVGVNLHLIHVGVVPRTSDGESRFFLGLDQVQELATLSFQESQRLLQELRERLSGQGVELDQAVVEGHPDTGLCGAARDLGADLVVVGSHGRTGLSHFFLGSVAERVVRLCEQAVLVARGDGGTAAGGFRKILVPTDFSDFSEQALATATVLAGTDAKIDVLHCWEMPPGAVLHYGAPPSTKKELDKLRSEIEERAWARGESIRRGVEEAGLQFRFSAEEAPAARGILARFEEEDDYDLVVMGSHGRRGFRRFILGSVAETTVRHAPCSVAVVPARSSTEG